MKLFKKYILVIVVALFSQQSYSQVLIDSLAGGGFELGTTFAANGWTDFSDPTEDNKWEVGSAAGGFSAGTRGAYISNDGGLTNAYTLSNVCRQFIYQDVTFPASQTAKLFFNWKCKGEIGVLGDKMMVFLVPTTYTLNYGIDIPASYQIGNLSGYSFSSGTGWNYEAIDIDASHYGTSKRLVFNWKNNNAGGEQPPIALDKIGLISFAPPGNNNCSGAFSLPTGATCTYTNGTTFLADASPEPSCAPTDANDDVWYKFVADDTRMKISVLGAAGFNAGFSVYSGTCAALNQLSCINNTGSGALETTILGGLTVGQTYLIRVYSIGSAVPSNSNFQICLNYPPPPATNDECATATVITPGVSCVGTAGSTLDASTSAQASPACAPSGTDDDVWYSFVATKPVLVTNVQGNAGFDPVIAIYSGASCAALNYINCVNKTGASAAESITVSTFTVGQTYYARVYSAGSLPPANPTFSICVYEGPQNDECAGAFSLPIGVVCTYTSGSTFNSSASPQTAPSCNAGTDDDVWFKFVADGSGLYVDLRAAASSTFDPAFAVYSGSCGALTEMVCVNETGAAGAESSILGALSLVTGTTYYIRVFGAGTGTVANPAFELCLNYPPPPPANDECIGAIAINTNQTCSYTTGSTLSASQSPQSAPACAPAGAINDDVWYSFVADKPVLVVKVQGSGGFNPVYALYSGTCGSLTEIACVNANATLGGLETKTITSFTVGATYYVRVYSGQTTTTIPSSDFQICVNWGPQNDECARAFSLATGIVCTTTTGTSNESTQSLQAAPSCAPLGINDDIWYSFVADSSRMEINVAGSAGFDAAFAFYSGTCSSLSQTACINDAAGAVLETRIFGSLVLGQTYYIRVYSVATSVPTPTSTFTICVKFPPPPPLNDECTDAILIPTGVSCTYTAGSTLYASQSSQIPPTCGGTSYDDDVWFKFVADTSRMKIDIKGDATFNPIFSVYSGSCLGFTSLMCNNATGNGGLETTVLSSLTVGQTYYVRVFGLGTTFIASPTFQICATYAPAPPVNDDCFNAINISTSATCLNTAGNTYAASGNTDYPDPGCGNNGVDDDIWYKFVADKSNLSLKVEAIGNFDPVVAVYYGNDCSNLTLIRCLNDGTAGVAETTTLTTLTLGRAYYIRVFGNGNSSAALSTNSGFNICLSHIQATFCAGANPFCSDALYTFPATTGSPAAEAGPAYGCLSTRPNPAWYWMRIEQPGNLTIFMSSAPARDIDFITWGPFASNNSCDELTAAKIVDCSYSGFATETADIPNAQVGQYYLFLITNYSNNPTQISFNQTNNGQTGAGKTDCAVICPLPIAVTTYNYCKNTTSTQLTATGSSLKWYTQAIGGVSSTVAPTPITTAVGTQNFWVTQTTSNCESARLKITVKVTEKPSNADILVTNGNCLGNNAAKVKVISVTDGAPPFTYSFNGAPYVSNNLVIGLPSNNNYTVQIKDVAGCTFITTVSMTSFAGPSSFTLTKVDPACGTSDGSVTISNVIDGTTPYLYSFNNSAYTSNSIYTGLAAGNYPIIVQDQKLCSYSVNMSLSNSGGPTDVDIAVVSTTCGSANGKVTFSNVQSVSTPFTYSFNNSPFSSNTVYTNVPSNLSSYSVTVKDNIGCIYIESFNVPNIAGPALISYTSVPTTCGYSNGSINVVSVTGGTASYTYSFNASPFSTNVSFTGLTANTTYTLSVKDNNACRLDSVFKILDIAGPTTFSINYYNATCGDPNGKIFINSVTGGTSPYSYSFNSGAFNTNTIVTGISPGTYTFSTKDANSCLFSKQIIVNNVAGPTATTYTVGPTYCNQDNGRVIVNHVAGGTPPYSYSFDGSVFTTDKTMLNLPESTPPSDTLIVMDANGCTIDTTYNIGRVAIPTAYISGGGTICGNSTTALPMQIDLSGLSPWTFAFTDGTNITTITNVASSPYLFNTLSQGNYSLISVTSEPDNCLSTDVAGQAIVTVNVVPDAPLVSDVRYCFNTDSLKLTSIGNVGAEYKWYSDAELLQQVGVTNSVVFYPPAESSVGVSTYYVKQIVNGCTSNAVKVNVSAEQVNANFTLDPMYGEKPLNVQATNLTSGTNTYVWDFGNSETSIVKDASFVYNEDGDYKVILTATSDIKCIDTASVTVKVEPNYSVIMPNVFSPNGDGSNDIYKITYIGVKSVTGYIYNRWGKKVFEIAAITDQWNGKIKGDGSDAPDGVYFLVLNVTPLFGDIKEYKGTVTLIR